jgi:hypothetical protein
MKKVTLFILTALFATASFAQGFSVGVGALAGSYSASSGVAVVNLTGLGTADASLVAKNEGTATASVSAGLAGILPLTPAPLVATGTGTSQNTTTVTPTVNLPAGGTGGAGGAGTGASFAAVGVQGFFVTVGPIPPIGVILPTPPILGTLPVF